MKKMRTRTAAVLATVLLLALAGCQSNSPTEPSTGGGSGGGGGTTNPPTSDIVITLTASNPNPVVGSSTLITARVTSGGGVVVDGTAIEFATNFGLFSETADTFALRTTTAGAATVTLSSDTVGTATVTARLGAVSRSITVTFGIDGGGGGGTGPTITSVNPSSGPPSGNQIVTITGTNLKGPVRVFFGSKEATVISATETQIRVVTPPTNLGPTDEFLLVDVRVITQVGSPNEGSVTLVDGYRYELEILTPEVITVSPSSGPNEGNTRITIFGSGFQSPVKVFFGAGNTQVEVEVISVTFSQILAITPPASGLGSDFINNSVSMRVLNVASNKEVTSAAAFRYGPKIEITGFQPASGSHLGGDRITIFGFGFDDPVSVSIGGNPAQVIRVSGTEIVATTAGLLACTAGGGGPVVVTNLEQSGDSNNTATSTAQFTYVVTTNIVDVDPLPLNEGAVAFVDVDDPGIGNVKFTIGGKTVFPTPQTATNPFAVQEFQFIVPTGLTFDEVPCVTGGGVPGTTKAVTDFDLVFTNILTGCTVTLSIPIAPLDTTCVTDPADSIQVSPGTLAFAPSDADGVIDTPELFVTVTNNGGTSVNLSSPTTSAPFTVTTPPGSPLGPGLSTTIGVSFNPTTPTNSNGTLVVSFTGGSASVTLTGSGTGILVVPNPVIAADDDGDGIVDNPDTLVTITNSSAVSITLGLVASSGPPFAVQTQPVTPLLAPGASTTMTVRFNPTAVGAFSETLTIPFTGGVTTVTMNGVGL